jgi:hypothetical protein
MLEEPQVRLPEYQDPKTRKLVREVWVDMPLRDRGRDLGWVGSYRVEPVNGRPVVAEVRLTANGKVPERGVPWEAVRALAPMRHTAEVWPEMVRKWRRKWGDEALFAQLGLLGRHGFASHVEELPKRPGRRGHPDLHWAAWAARRASADPRQPIRSLWDEERAVLPTVTREYVRDQVKRAKAHGMLDDDYGLTATARRVLAAHDKASGRRSRRKGGSS